MPLNTQLADATVNTQADALSTLCNGGLIRVYNGAQPATANTALSGNTLGVTLTFGNPAFPAAVGGLLTANAITPGTAVADITPTFARIFKSDVITDLMKVLGCGVEVQGKAAKELNQFDLNNLRWSKVVICTDGDVDGFQIRTLILTMLYRLCPTLIREGYVYIAETPLFEITCKEKSGEKTWFAYSEKEKADILKKLEGKKVNVQRSKGLGENDPEMMWMTTMSPETRRLIRVLPEDAEETARVFDLLLGDNLSGRKDYIAENGYKYLDMIDVS